MDAQLVVTLVREERKIQPRLGTRNFMLKGTLAQGGVKLRRGRWFEVLSQHDLLLESKPSESPSTTHSQHYQIHFRT